MSSAWAELSIILLSWVLMNMSEKAHQRRSRSQAPQCQQWVSSPNPGLIAPIMLPAAAAPHLLRDAVRTFSFLLPHAAECMFQSTGTGTFRSEGFRKRKIVPCAIEERLTRTTEYSTVDTPTTQKKRSYVPLLWIIVVQTIIRRDERGAQKERESEGEREVPSKQQSKCSAPKKQSGS